MSEEPTRRAPTDKVFSTIVTDIHFWIPLLVLLAGLLLLHKLR